MLRYTVVIAVALVAAIVVMPMAVQASGRAGQESYASGGDGFTVQDRPADSPVNVESWWDDPLADPPSENAWSLAAQTGEYPSALLAGGLDDDPFLLDGRFRGGKIYTDRFGASSNGSDQTNKWVQKALRLSNGDVVTVALVPKDGATSHPPSGAGWNIGMVRYNAAGVKQKWTNAAASLTDSTRSYYIFPNKDQYDGNGSYTGIHDVKEHDGWIYVLAQRYRSATDKTYDVRLVRFQLSSSKWKWSNILGSASVSEWGVGMRFDTWDSQSQRLIVAVGRTVAPGKYETWMQGYVVRDSSELSLNPVFGDNGVSNVSPEDCDSCRPVAFAAGKIGQEVTYIAGNYAHSSTDQNIYYTKFDMYGTSIMSIVKFSFPEKFNDQRDEVREIVIELARDQFGAYDRVYILAAVQDICGTSSAGVAKFDSVGNPETSFGTNAMLVFGGGGNMTCTTTRSIKPRAMALNGNRLAIVGYSTRHVEFVLPGTPHDTGGPSFSVVDKDIGYVSDSRVLAPTGVDIGDNGGNGLSTFLSVVPSEDDSFYAVGDARDTKNQKMNVPMTARVRADRIFGNGLE